MNLTERQIEDVFAAYPEELIEPGLTLEDRQANLPNSRLRADLIFRDRNGKKLVLELKRDSVSREDVGQILEYAGVLGDCRVVLAAPHFAASIKTAFEHYGIEYLEFSVVRMIALRAKLQGSTVKDRPAIQRNTSHDEVRSLARSVIAEPLSARRLHDGNIAFKVSYNDRDWSRVCSPEAHHFNVFEKKVPWCVHQSDRKDNCQSGRYKNKSLPLMSRPNYPCYDAVAVESLCFSPGWNNTANPPWPHRCLEAKRGKIALLTSRSPGEAEDQRFIVAVLEIAQITTSSDGEETYHGSRETSIVMSDSRGVRFWDFYSNPRSPDTIMWGSGLFRYVDDDVIARILEAIATSKACSAEQRRKASYLRGRY